MNEKPQFFRHNYAILTHEADAFGLWRVDGAFRLMQEMAGAHSTELSVARSDLLQSRNCIWMLARVQFEIYKYPKLYDTVYATTWYGPIGRITYPRYVAIQDAAGEQIAAFATSWVVVDIDTRRILLPAKMPLEFPPPAELEPPFPEPTRLSLQLQGEPGISLRAPMYSDLDINAHMNNASYATWILDLFPMEWHRGHRIRSLTISYAAEATPGEEVRLALYQDGLQFEVQGTDAKDGHTIFEAKGLFQEVTPQG